jgi:hypothetical protein
MGFPYNDNDTVLVGFEGGPGVHGSVQQECHICQRKVWCSPATFDTVLDAKIAQGGKVYISCLYCVDAEDIKDAKISKLQLAEFKRTTGFDIEELAQKTGKSIDELVQQAIKHLQLHHSLQRAAKKEDT